MHIIFNDATRARAQSTSGTWAPVSSVAKSRFMPPDEMRRVFPSLDNFRYKDKWWVLDVGGNHLRIIAFIQFVQGRLYIKHILTHAEYDKLCRRYAKGELS